MYCWFCGHPITFPIAVQNPAAVLSGAHALPSSCADCGAGYEVRLLYPPKMSAEQLKKVRNAYTEQAR